MNVVLRKGFLAVNGLTDYGEMKSWRILQNNVIGAEYFVLMSVFDSIPLEWKIVLTDIPNSLPKFHGVEAVWADLQIPPVPRPCACRPPSRQGGRAMSALRLFSKLRKLSNISCNAIVYFESKACANFGFYLIQGTCHFYPGFRRC